MIFLSHKIDQIKNSETNNFKILCEVFKNRVVEKSSTLYYIHSIELTENCIKCMKLYDKNKIKVDLEYYTKKGIFISFKFPEFDNNFKIFSSEQSEQILKDHENSNRIIKVFYKLEAGENIQTEGLVYYKSLGKRLQIVKLLPEDLDITQYDIDTAGNMINNVKNKEDNIKVVYTIEEVKEEIDNMPVSLQVYFSYYKKTVNILHIHKLNEKIDLHDGFEVFHLEKNEDVKTYNNWTSSHKMRILFRNYKINKIFYKESDDKFIELKAEEFNYKLDRIVKIQCDGYLNNHLAKVKKIPIYQLANTHTVDNSMIVEEDYTILNEKIDICSLTNESEYLTGYLDLTVLFDQDGKYLDYPINVALPACFLSFLPVMKEMEFEKIVMAEGKKRKADEIVTFDNLYKDVTNNYEKFLNNKELLKNVSKEEIKLFVKTLEGYRVQLSEISRYVERNELWSYLEVNNILI